MLRAWLQGGGRALAVHGLIGKTCDYEVSFLVIKLQKGSSCIGVSDKMSRISLRGRAAVWGTKGEGNLGAPCSRRVLQRWQLGDLITAYAAVGQGTISGEMLDGICRDPHRVIWSCLKAAVNFCKRTSFTDKRNYFILQIALSSRAISQHTFSAPAHCLLELVRIKQHFP